MNRITTRGKRHRRMIAGGNNNRIESNLGLTFHQLNSFIHRHFAALDAL